MNDRKKPTAEAIEAARSAYKPLEDDQPGQLSVTLYGTGLRRERCISQYVMYMPLKRKQI